MEVTIREQNLGHYTVPEDVKGGTCVDVGANVGNFTDTHKNYFSLIHYYEPFLGCYEICLHKFKDIDNVIGYNEAVFSETTRHNLLKHQNSDSGSSALDTETINAEWNPEDVIQKVSCVDLDTILERIGGHIDYMKCDCETSEYHLLMNKDLSAINYLALELHWQMGSNRFIELTNHIKKTHELMPSNCDHYRPGKNTECMYRLKG